MIEEARITFYRILKCGYYQYAAPNPEFGQITDILAQLKTWVSPGRKNVSETKTYEIEDADNLYPTYCYDIQNHSGNNDYLITTWNETPSHEGQVASVKLDGKVGSADVSMTDIPENSIPGYATYFWFIPSQNVFATICFQHRLNGHVGLVKYLQNFMAKFTSYCVGNDNDEDNHEITGYRVNNRQATQDLRPQFKTRQYTNPALLAYLRQNQNIIRKIIRKDNLSIHNAVELDIIQKLLNHLNITRRQSFYEEYKIKYEIPHKPTIEQLNQIISNWQENHEGKYDDVGFELTGENKIFWLSHSVAKDSVDLDITRSNDEIVSAASLLAKLTENRDRILNLIQ